MTIRDMENTTGLTRANIRFYEAQGLISPERKENNYREYSEQDRDVLLRIRLLRTLGMTIEQIRALQNGAENLIAALDQQIELLSRQQEQLGHAQRVCRQMREDDVRYETLDARRYLDSLEHPPKQAAAVIDRDVEPRIFAPWQRYWARALDGLVCSYILTAIVTWMAGGVILEWGGLISTAVGFAMTLVLEPLQLWLFGTTLGKWIFGIRVTDMEGRKLCLSDAFLRTWRVIVYGEGLGVPIVSLWRNWKSYQAYENNEFLPWDDPSELSVRDTKPLRYLAALGVAAAVFGVSVVSITLAQLPEYRGSVTVAQFCENYRKIARQNGWDNERFTLRDDGTWAKTEPQGTFYIDMSANPQPLALIFTTEGGKVTGVSFSESIPGAQENWIGGRSSQLRFTALAFLMAQPEYSIFAGDEKQILTAISDHPFEDFSITSCGLEFRYDVEYTGYWSTDLGYLIEDDDPETEPNYSMNFSITKTGSAR